MRKLGLISVDLEDFKNEVLPRTVEGTYKGKTLEDKYQDFKKQHPKGKMLFVKQFGHGDRIAVRFYPDRGDN